MPLLVWPALLSVGLWPSPMVALPPVAGGGWALAELRHALYRAQRINQPLWTAFDALGTTLGVPELRDLASSIELAGAQGTRVRQSLAGEANTLRHHRSAATEAAAEATTEPMNLRTAALLGSCSSLPSPAVTAITSVGQGALQLPEPQTAPPCSRP